MRAAEYRRALTGAFAARWRSPWVLLRQRGAARYVALLRMRRRGAASIESAQYHRRMAELWCPSAEGVLSLPSGRLLRGRGLRQAEPDGPEPAFGLYLLSAEPPAVSWESRWIRWPDFRLPADRTAAREGFLEAWRRCATERVEVACAGGRGRTGTALACIAVLDGVRPESAVAYVREHYSRHAVETPWQRRFVARFR